MDFCEGNLRVLTRILVVFTLKAICLSTNSFGADDNRLNVVFIMADDLGWSEVGCFGQAKIPTPNIDRLAKEGMRLTRHYSGAPVCAPSRCVLMTGLHLGHAQIRGNRPASLTFPQFTEGQHPLAADSETLPRAFRSAGYATGAFGKWGLGPVGSTGDPNDQGFDEFFGYNCQSVAHSYYPPYLWRNRDKLVFNNSPIPAHPKLGTDKIRSQDWVGENYAPQRIADEAIGFLRKNHERPFLLYLPFIQPHVAMHPQPEMVNRFPKDWDTTSYRGEGGYLPHNRPRAAYAAMISEIDDYVGRVLNLLEELKISDRTLVVFTSDNGTTHAGPSGSPFHVGGVDAKFFQSTGPLRGYKGSLYEGGIRVPTIVRLPGKIVAGTESDVPSYFPDWFPTLAEATGLEGPSATDGESMWQHLIGQSNALRKKPMVWVFTEYGGQVAVRIGPYKIIRQRLSTQEPDPWEVYDLSADESERHNLAPMRPDLIQQSIEILKREVSANPTFPLKIPGVNSPTT